MNLYSCETFPHSYIVAESMTKAIEAYEKEYGEPPNQLRKISGYVIIAEKSEAKSKPNKTATLAPGLTGTVENVTDTDD